MNAHIAISGELGSGKTSVATAIAAHLGLEMFSTGEMQREIARSMQLSTLDLNRRSESDLSIDEAVDGEVRRRAAESTSPMVFDSRLAWHTIGNAFRVRLIADPHVAVERIHRGRKSLEESYESVLQAEESLLKRYTIEKSRFESLYGVDITRLRNFDLVVDSSDLTIDEVAHLISREWDTFDVEQRDITNPKIFASPRRVIPVAYADTTSLPSDGDGDGDELQYVYSRPYLYLASPSLPLIEALDAQRRILASGRLLAEASEAFQGQPAASMYRLANTELLRSLASKYGTEYDGFYSWKLIARSETPQP